MAGHDSVVVMPTGGGKSLTFQLPALIMEGTAIVVSPLIALMQDQVDSLIQNGIAAAFLNSSMTGATQNDVIAKVERGQIKLLYVAPERMVTRSFYEMMCRIRISLIAIDEAHCISSWGHDFRPEYAQMYYLKAKFPEVPIIALTATADKATRQDIVKQLRLPNPEVYLLSFDRPNITMNVRPGIKRIEQIIRILGDYTRESGIIYSLSQKSTEQIAERLKKAGFNAAAYHAGLPPDTRRKVLSDFIADRTKIVCATVAFGMGINKSNVRFVMHYNMPKNVEGYYQEIGRAGRDGLPSVAYLFYSYADLSTLEGFINQASPMAEIERAKLMRMRDFSESYSCRGTMLLSYFGETPTTNCKHCDNCETPPEGFDGTIVAQKALSAVTRLEQKAATNMLINVLRGMHTADLIRAGYDRIRTYGAGREYSHLDWQQFIIQLQNQGILEIDMTDNHFVKLTPLSQLVLQGIQPVTLRKIVFGKKTEVPLEVPTKLTKREEMRILVQTRLKEFRFKLAEEQGIVPTHIFDDRTIVQLAEKRPIHISQFIKIEGVTQVKAAKFGHEFTQEMCRIYIEIKDMLKGMKGETHKLTFAYYQANYEPEAIATERGYSVNTIFSHYGILWDEKYPIELDRIFPPGAYQTLATEWEKTPDVHHLNVCERLDNLYPIGMVQLVKRLEDARK
ncbi:MAG: hypothetical protein RIS47_136 [Bacteroidota bacterium]